MSLKNQLTENVKLLQKAVVIRQSGSTIEALLLQRSGDAASRPNCWDLPGGNSEWPVPGQFSIANLHLGDIKREILEETSLQVDEKNFDLKNLVHFSTYFDSDKQVFTIICGWMIDFSLVNQSEIKISDEHQKYAWVSEIDLLDYDFGGNKGAFILDMVQKSFAKFKARS